MAKPDPTIEDFQALIEEGQDSAKRAIRQSSVESVLRWFAALRPRMSNESVDTTLEYLTKKKWVKDVASPAAHEHYKRAKGNGKRKKPRLFFPDLIIVLATFQGNRTVNTLVNEYSAHWGFDFSKEEPSYPSGLDPITERRLFEGIAIGGESVEASTPGTVDSGLKRKSDPSSELSLLICKKSKPISGPTREPSLESHSSSSHPADLDRVGYATNPFHVPVKTPDLQAKPFDLHSKSSNLRLTPSGNQGPVFDDESDFVSTPTQRAWYEEQISKSKRASKAAAGAYVSSSPMTDQSSNNRQTREHGEKHAQNSSVLTKPQVVNNGVKPTSSSRHHEEPDKQQSQETASNISAAQCCKEIKEMAMLHQNMGSTLAEKALQMVQDAQNSFNKDKERYERDILRYSKLSKTQARTINKLETELNSTKKDLMILRETQEHRTTAHEPEYQTKSTSNDSFPMKQLIDTVKETMTREMAKGTEDIKTAVTGLLDEAIYGDRNSTS
ncbi:hypothetical protein ACHAPQ_011947 [Fusarium lateritium]